MLRLPVLCSVFSVTSCCVCCTFTCMHRDLVDAFSRTKQKSSHFIVILDTKRSGLDIQCTEFSEDDVRVIERNKKREEKERNGKRKKGGQRLEAMEKSKASKEAYWSDGTKLVTMKSVVADKTWGSHAAVLTPNETYKIRAQMGKSAGKGRTASLTLFFEMKRHGSGTCAYNKLRGSLGIKLRKTRIKEWKKSGSTQRQRKSGGRPAENKEALLDCSCHRS